MTVSSVISNLFNTSTPIPAPAAPAAPAQTPTNPGNLPDNSGVGATTPPTPGAPTDPAAAPAKPDSPLDQYKSLWDPVPTSENAAPVAQKLDPAKLQEIVAKADFTKAITPEMKAAISAGGEEAQAALMSALNEVTRQAVVQSTLAANKMTEQAVKDAIDSQTKSLPDLIRSQATTNSLYAANPIFSNPAVKPVIEAVKAQLAAKNPTATSDELTAMSQQFVEALGESISPKAAETVDPKADAMDWAKYLAGN